VVSIASPENSTSPSGRLRIQPVDVGPYMFLAADADRPGRPEGSVGDFVGVLRDLTPEDRNTIQDAVNVVRAARQTVNLGTPAMPAR
jgi:hypothetical protein